MMIDAWPSETQRLVRMRWAWAWLVAITLLHFALGTRGFGLRHAVHVGLAALYLLPILLAARARLARGGTLVALSASLLYLAHVALRDSGAGTALIDELAVVAGFLAVGGISGALLGEVEKRRAERDRVLLAARRSEVRNALEALLTALEARDPELGEHSRRVADLAELVARRLGLGRELRAQIHLAGLLHDVGKIGLRDDVLFSNGSLSTGQREQIEGHPARAAELVRAIGGDEELAEIVLAHHEAPDGSGYPRGLRGEEIPIEARVLHVADVCVAITERRRYRASESLEDALAALRRMIPDELDPIVFAALEAVVQDGWWLPAPAGERETRQDPGGDRVVAGARGGESGES